MPRYDKTGPNGKGSKTGRGLGDCDSRGKKSGRVEKILDKIRGTARDRKVKELH